MAEAQTDTGAGGVDAGGHVRGRELTFTSVFAAILVAAVMGLSYPYMVLKLGFGPNVSIVSAFFGFVILRMFTAVGGTYDRWQNNIVQTAGTSAAQTAFMCIVLASFDMLRDSKLVSFQLAPTPEQTFVWLSTLSLLGVLLAVPMRRHFVVDEKLPFPDGIAAAETLKVLDPPRGSAKGDIAYDQARRAAILLGIGMLSSAALMFFREDAQLFKYIPEGWTPGDMTLGVVGVSSFVLARMGVGASFSLLSIGSGMIIGLRISLWLMVGVCVGWIVAPYFLLQNGILTDNPSRTQVLFWLMWPAIGMIVAAGMTILAVRWRLLAEAFRGLGSAGGSGELPLFLLLPGIVGLAAAVCYLQELYFGMPIWMSALAIVVSVPLMLVGLRALGETNWGPISALSNMMQGMFAVIAPGNVNANIMGNATTGTIASTSEGLMQDYKTGHLIGSTPRAMLIAQIIGAPVGAAALAWTYPLLVSTYGIIGENAQLAAPTARRAAGFAEILSAGVDALPVTALMAMAVAALLGIVFALAEDTKWKNWVPSPTGLGLGFLLPFSAVATIFVGAVLGTIWWILARRSAEVYAVPLASGFIAGEALVAVLVPVLLSAGFGGG